MFKCAIIGAGGSRAHGHAAAYRLIRRGKLVAVSSRQLHKLDAFAREYDVEGRYTDYRVMLERERPDVVHVNAPPTFRAEIIRAASELDVPALIIEKPVALQAEDFRELCHLAQTVRTKVVINHQLHFHPHRMVMQQRVADGQIGQVRFIDASAMLSLAAQGTHLLEAIGALNVGGRVATVLGQVSGDAGLVPTARAHLAPDITLAAIGFDNHAHGMLRCGPGSPMVLPDKAAAFHKRISVYGEMGSAHWTMWDWRLIDRNGTMTGGSHDYFEQDLRAQVGLTEAMFDWLEDDARTHPLHLRQALRDFEVILATYTSAIHRRVVALPFEPEDGLLDKLRTALATPSNTSVSDCGDLISE